MHEHKSSAYVQNLKIIAILVIQNAKIPNSYEKLISKHTYEIHRCIWKNITQSQEGMKYWHIIM